MYLTPSGDSGSDFWILSGSYIVLRFSLNRTATVYTAISNKDTHLPIAEWSGNTSGRYISANAPTSGKYRGIIRNASSYAITVTGAVFDWALWL